jgi:hypothetical protein
LQLLKKLRSGVFHGLQDTFKYALARFPVRGGLFLVHEGCHFSCPFRNTVFDFFDFLEVRKMSKSGSAFRTVTMNAILSVVRPTYTFLSGAVDGNYLINTNGSFERRHPFNSYESLRFILQNEFSKKVIVNWTNPIQKQKVIASGS